MIKVKDGYAKLIGTTYAGSAERVLLSNGGDFGLHTGTNNQANKIVRTDANGYIYAGWINTTSGNFTGTPTKIYASNDAFIRYMTPANFFPTLANDNNQLSVTVGGQNRKLTVAYATTAATVICSEATSDNDRPIVVTNKSNGLYYTTKATLNYKTGNITAPTFTGDLKGNINPFKSLSYTSGTSTVKNVKDELVTAFSNIGNGIGANVIVPAYAISYWDTESTIVKDSNVYSMIKIGGGYSGTTYGLWLLSTYSSNRIGYVGRDGNAWTSISWIATTADINSLKNYYWADVKISSSSNSATKPTFATATATTSVITPLVNSTGRLTLNATNTGLDLKFNGDGTKSVILNGTAFKPFDAATGKLSLGTSNARWSALYSGTGNFTGDVTLLSSSGDSPKLYFVRGGAIGDSGALWDWRMYSSAGHFYLLSDLGTGTWSTLLFINTSNNVGIGTTSPAYKLDVVGSAGFGTSSACDVFLRRSGGYSYINAVSSLALTVNNNSGNIAIGIATDKHATFYGSQTLYGLTSTCNKSSDSNYMNSALQIREYNFGGALTDSWGIAPRLSWHWSGRVQTQIGLNSSGDLKLSKDNFTTSYLLLHAGNSSVSGGGSSGGSSITVNIGGTSKTLTIPTSLPANGGNADTVDNLHATSFAIWRGDASTDSTATDTSSTSTADFFAKINATSGLFNSRFGAMRGSWWYVGNTQLNTGVGTLEMAGTAVLNLGSHADTNDTYKSLLFLDQGGRLWSYTANETSVKQWSRYVKTTDKIANASWADGASTVTVNDSNANSTYRMVWHSGNTLYSTAGIYCNPATDYLYATSVQTSDWFRSSGNTGWYSQTHGGGWYMTDSTWVRTYNSKGVLGKGFYHSDYGSANYLLTSNGGAWAVHTGRNNEANKIVRTDGSGYANFGWINTTSGTASGTITRIYCSQDGYIRYLAPADVSVGHAGTSDYLKVHDIRNNNYAPNSTSWPLNKIRAWFNNTGTPDGTWWSGITAKGWDSTYNVWLLAGTSHNTDYNIKGLFFRTGNGSTWDDWLSVSTARIFTVANNTAVADFVKGYKLLYAGQWFSRRDYAWASSATINVGSYGLDRMRYSAVCVRTGNLNETYQQSAMLFVPTFSDRKFLYLAQMYTSGTAGSVTTSVKRYADYDTIIQGSSEHVTLIWMGYIHRESTAVTTWTAVKQGGPATFNLTISNSARSGTNSQNGANLGGNCPGYTILGGICNTRYFGQGNLSAGSTNWTTCRDSGMGDYMVYADGTNIYVRQWKQIDENNGSSSNDALGSTAINNLSNNNYGYAFTRSFALYIFGYKNNNL